MASHALRDGLRTFYALRWLPVAKTKILLFECKPSPQTNGLEHDHIWGSGENFMIQEEIGLKCNTFEVYSIFATSYPASTMK